MNPFSIHDQGAALISTGLIAKSDRIQSARNLLTLWDEMRRKILIESRLDYLVSILAYGQLMDRKLPKGDYFEFITDSINNIRQEIIDALTYPILGEKGGTPELAEVYIVRLNDASSAFLTAAYTSVSQKIESTKEVIELWLEIRDKKLVEDNNGYLTALLACSRLNDLKKIIDNGSGLNVILENFKTLLPSVKPDIRVSKIDLASAHLTSALISQSPEIESNTKVLEIWDKIKNELIIDNDDLNITASILSSGLILNRTTKLDLEDIRIIYDSIKVKLPDYRHIGDF
jgi:hypothetical protein